jgi:hypothetical protein
MHILLPLGATPVERRKSVLDLRLLPEAYDTREPEKPNPENRKTDTRGHSIRNKNKSKSGKSKGLIFCEARQGRDAACIAAEADADSSILSRASTLRAAGFCWRQRSRSATPKTNTENGEGRAAVLGKTLCIRGDPA